jgi:hypothetical protein
VRGVRIRDGEFEGQCDYCREYLPLTDEFWPMRNAGLRRCKACVREYKRLRQQGYKASRPGLFRANKRATYASMTPQERARRLAVNRAWKAAHQEHIKAYRRAYYERTRAA